jgi:predicted ribosome quality control (RQC) complex YloA/Tae2 family protein
LVAASRVIAVKLGLTSLDLLAIVKELNSALISARIDNVYQLEDESFLIRLHAKSGQANIIIDLGRRLNVTNFKYPTPEKPSPFATYLRRYLSSAKVESLGQVDFDRIIYIDLSRGEERFRVYFELFGDGNAIVTNRYGRIKYAISYRVMKDRTIKYGMEYIPPPQRGHDISTSIGVDEIRSQKFNLARTFTRVFNLPSEMVEEAILRSLLDPNFSSAEVNSEMVEAFLRSARSIVEEVKTGKLKPNIVIKEGKSISVQPIDFRSMNHEKRYLDSFNEAVDEYFASISTEKIETKRRSPAEEALKDLEAVLSRQKSRLKELEEQRIRQNEIGRSIMSNLHLLQSLINQVISSRKAGADWESIMQSISGVKIGKIDSSKGLLTVVINDQEIRIDFKMSATKNADSYFTKSKEASKKLEGLHDAIVETEKKIEKLKSGISAISVPVVVRAMKKEWYERFRWTFSSQNFLIVGGRDAAQNEVLVKKHMGPEDIFAHSEAPGGSVVIIKSEGRKIPEETKYEAVSFAVAYSRSWRAGLGGSDGYWVKSDQVTKTPPTGEYLVKGAFMIYGERNYVRNIPLAMWLGIQISGDAFKIVMGNEAFVRKTAASYVKLTPGTFSGVELIKKIKESLVHRCDQRYAHVIHAIPDSEIAAHLPTGGSSVL